MLLEKTYKGKRVLITGNTGFKGSWLSIWLLEMGADVFGYALNPLTPHDNYNTSQLASKYHHVTGDIRDRKKFIDYVNDIKPEFIFHMAAQPIVLTSYKDAVETFEVNMMGTVNFFEAVRQCPSVKVAINVTSDKCYDNKEWIWGYRENDPMGGKDPYSASKGCSELITSAYLHSFFKDSSCHVASARAGNVIGGGDWSEYRIVPDFFRAYLGKETLLIRNPDATRPWQFVLEPLFGYLTLGATLFEKGKDYEGGWNFGPLSQTHKTVQDLIESIKSNELFKSVGVNYTKPEFHEATFLKLDITKATTQLGWKPVLNFEQTMKFTIEGYADELNQSAGIYDSRVKQIKEYTKHINGAG